MSDSPQSPAIETPVPATTRSPLRVFPIWLFLAALIVFKAIPMVVTEFSQTIFMLMIFGPVLCGVALVLWWLFASRATGVEKIVGLVAFIAAMATSYMVNHPSMQQMFFLVYVLPYALIGLCVALLLARNATPGKRSLTAFAGLALPLVVAACVRNNGMWGDFRSDFVSRWEPTGEEIFLAKLREREPIAGKVDPNATLPDAQWASFRGPARDSVCPDIQLVEDWNSQPPTSVWQTDVGAGWGSFAVAGDYLFTQEQRGEEEAVVCYDANTGKERWIQTVSERFYEPIAGAGPRATPTIQDGMIYTLGANGRLQKLKGVTGEAIWDADVRQAAKVKPPIWGFSASPLIVSDLVIVHAGGPSDDPAVKGEQGSVLAYSIEDGNLRWSTPSGSHSYGSPQLSTVAGQTVVLMLTNQGLEALDPESGEIVGKHEWEFQGYRALQPLVFNDNQVLVGTGMGTGTQCVTAKSEGGKLTFTVEWETLQLKPDFNDFVAHEGFVYGYDHDIFCCIDLKDGTRKWRGGRYGAGQVLLLPAANQLLVLSEKGELVLLAADPEELRELAKWQAIEGKTWNHPALVEDRLYIRNGEHATCVRLPVLKPTAQQPEPSST